MKTTNVFLFQNALDIITLMHFYAFWNTGIHLMKLINMKIHVYKKHYALVIFKLFNISLELVLKLRKTRETIYSKENMC